MPHKRARHSFLVNVRDEATTMPPNMVPVGIAWSAWLLRLECGSSSTSWIWCALGPTARVHGH